MIDPVPIEADDEGDALRPMVRDDIVLRTYGMEAVGWSPISPRPIHLDPVSALVIQMLDGSVSVGELIADIHDVIGVPPAIARSQLRRILAWFDAGGILSTSRESIIEDGSIDLFPAPPNP